MKPGPALFSKKTYAYFEAARKNRKNREWFQKHKAEYEEFVHEPFLHLTERLKSEFSEDLQKIDFGPRKISRPVRRNPDEDGGLLRSNAFTYFCEKNSSQFEWNPGTYISIGSKMDENVLGMGMYMVSSRQMSLLRQALVSDFENIDQILSSKKLKSRWGSLSGELYTRFPRGYDENGEAAKYLRHKQFFLGQDLTQKRVLNKNFADEIVKDIEGALPFLKWIRKSVGTYQGRFSRS